MRRWLHWRVVVAAALGIACGVAVGLGLAGTFRRRGGGAVAEKKPGKVYVVQRIYWHYVGRSEPHRESEPAGAGHPGNGLPRPRRRGGPPTGPGAQGRKGRCPFEHGLRWGHSLPSLDDLTSTPTGEFLDWLEAEGLPLPAGQREAWRAFERGGSRHGGLDQRSFDAWWAWWDANFRSREGEPVCDRVWDKLDRVRFFEVVEIDAEL